MSTQHIIQKCEIDASYCKFGAQTLLKNLNSFEDLIEGVIKNTDIEYVHKTRVTSRRLRTALTLFSFCFPKKQFKTWQKEIKKVTRLLGEARDLDVQITFIQQYIKKQKAPIEKDTLNLLLKDHKAQRKRKQTFVEKGLDELKATNTISDFIKSAEQTISNLKKNTFDSKSVLKRAHLQISCRIDDFLSMEPYVHQANKKTEHHQMRIYAKKLRYTMECFAPLFKNKLEKEIKNMKAFQDLLGEMHDSDVWIDYIPKFKEKIQNKLETTKKLNSANLNRDQTLQNFSTFIQERKTKAYIQFVSLWENNKGVNFFEQLRKKTLDEAMVANKEKIEKILRNSNVKIAVLSDTHANLQALEEVIGDAKKRGAKVFLNAGDSIGFGANPNEVIQLLCENNVLSIKGNFDIEILENKGNAKGEKRSAYKFAKKELTNTFADYLENLPYELRMEVAGKKILMVHGSPDSINEHIRQDTPNQRLQTLSEESKADIIIVGHSHEQFQTQTNNTLFINPGSVGRPGDGNPQAAYAILSFNPLKVEMIRTNYDVKAAVKSLRKKGLPESFAQMLLRGVSLDSIIDEDQTKKESIVNNCKQAVETSENLSKNYWPDTEHYQKVTHLALQLFDKTLTLHNLGKRERCWLECASILHDIGLSESTRKHHKMSAQFILNDTKLPFTSTERRVIASIARYHRRGLPKNKHYNLASLNQETVNKISTLSSILRIADSLDYTHQSNVDNLEVKIAKKRVTINYSSKTELQLEEQAFNKKKDLFEKVFDKKTVLIWKQK